MKRIFPFLFILALVACSGSGIQTQADGTNDQNNPPVGDNPMSTADSFASASANQNVVSLGSSFPPDFVIPDIDGMRDTGFALTFFPPAVVPFNLNANPVAVSTQFPLFDASAIPEAAFPNRLEIVSPTQGFLLSGSHVVYFNPSTGTLLGTQALGNPITLTQPLAYSRAGDCDFNGTPESSVPAGPFTPTFPADLAVVGNRLFVTMSNACFDASFESFYQQSILLAFDINAAPPYLTPAAKPFLILAGFNATGIAVNGNSLIVTSTGDTTLSGAVSLPDTDSFLTEVDPTTFAITRILNLGAVAANFQPLAISSDGAEGFIGSSSFSEVYQIDLPHFTVVRGKTNPIQIYDQPSDYISDQEVAFGDQILFVSSFNNSAVRAIDLNGAPLGVLPDILDFAFPGNPGVTGVGTVALRPGQPGIDFQGEDLWVLTGSPGTIGTARTY